MRAEFTKSSAEVYSRNLLHTSGYTLVKLLFLGGGGEHFEHYTGWAQILLDPCILEHNRGEGLGIVRG